MAPKKKGAKVTPKATEEAKAPAKATEEAKAPAKATEEAKAPAKETEEAKAPAKEATSEKKDVEMKVEEAKDGKQTASSEEVKVDMQPVDTKAVDEKPKEDDIPVEASTQAEAPKEPEKPKELEEDMKADGRAKVAAGSVVINESDSTLNVMPTVGGRLLMTLTEGGLQCLLAGARANAGMKCGRYMFEFQIVESLNPAETQWKGRSPQPKQLLRIGFSLAGSSLFLADSSSVCFDSEGFYIQEKKRMKVTQRFQTRKVYAVLLNLDSSSPNYNTVSLFFNGKRACEPQLLPESLQGKVLYPTVAYRNITLEVNFGPVARAPLPFTCPMIAAAATADLEISTVAKDAENEVLIPLGLPAQGYRDWVDDFLEKNPSYTELSERSTTEWASKSGCFWPKGGGSSASAPRPETGVRNALNVIAPTLRRNYILTELKCNLIPEERKEVLRCFPGFKKKAAVVMGEPTQQYKEQIQSLILAKKVAQAEAERKRKKMEEDRKRLMEERKRRVADAQKAKKEGTAEEEKDDVEMGGDKKDEIDGAKTDEAVQVELTEDEKKTWYRNPTVPDISEEDLKAAYASFVLPTKEEGFDDISFLWQPEGSCSKLLRDWIMEQKLTQRVEDLKPGDWFKEQWTAWQKQLQEWKKKQGEWKNAVRKKELAPKKDDDADKVQMNAEDIDVFQVEDVCDIGSGEPLFANFAYEDWALLSVRFEFHLLLHAFRRDLNDPDRQSFGEAHLPFYYQKYFKKNFNMASYNMSKLSDFVQLITDAVSIEDGSNAFLKCNLPEDAPLGNFVKLAEDHRRERQRRLDAGDETAQLKFTQQAVQQQAQRPGVAQVANRPGHSAGGASNFQAQKRPYQAPAAYSNKQARTNYGGGYAGYYRR